jgi:NADH:ubiquinone oxidoreductase subunit H
MIIFILIGSIYFILLDELIMGCSQRRIGPLNLGSYGILPSIINGCNLIIPQLRVPKIHFHLGFHVFPLFKLSFASLRLISRIISAAAVILLLNFLSILFPLGFELFRYSIIESTLLIPIIYSSALVLLFLVNGLLVLSSFRNSYYYRNLSLSFPLYFDITLD